MQPLMPMRAPQACWSNSYLRAFPSGGFTDALLTRVAPEIDMDDMADEAIAFMQPRLDEGNSLVNFVLELKDLKHMNPVGSIKRIIKGRPALVALSGGRSSRRRFVKELTSRLNGAALNASFGIAPFVRDIVSIYDELTTLSAKLARLKRGAGKVQTRHYKRVIPVSPGVFPDNKWTSEGAFAGFNWPTNFKNDTLLGSGVRDKVFIAHKGRWILRPVYHATWSYIYTLDSMSDIEETIRTHLDALGVRLDPGIVWDAIPFSFVIDWVVDVSGFLHSFARNNYPIHINSGDFIHSYAWHKEVATHMLMNDAGISTFTPIAYGPLDPVYKRDRTDGAAYVQVYYGSRSYYNRVKAVPSLHTAQVRGPTIRQAALAGSLLLSRKKGWNNMQYLSAILPKIPTASAARKPLNRYNWFSKVGKQRGWN
jgi:hypothetical protein